MSAIGEEKSGVCVTRHQKPHFNHTGEILPGDRQLGHIEMSILGG